MKRLSSAPARRVAALALAAALAAAAYAALVQPLLRLHAQYDQRIAALRSGLEKAQRIASSRAEAERALEEHRRRDAARPYYLQQVSPALAAAELQGLVKRAVAQAGGELISTQVLAAQAPDRPREIAVSARARGDVRALQRMLYELESGLPLVFVERLSVDAQPGGELLVAFEASAQRSARPARAGAAAPAARELFAFGALEDYAQIARRPLFDPLRRSSPEAPVVAPALPGEVSLAGLLLRPGRKVALVQRAGASQLIGLEPGDMLDGWELVDVRVDRIVLRHAGHSREMILRE